MCKVKEFLATLGEEVTMSKKEYVLTITTCLLGGMVLGMFLSPRKYVKIGSGNGSNNTNNKATIADNKAGKEQKAAVKCAKKKEEKK